MNREDELAYFREKLRPYVTEVMTRLDEEYERKCRYERIIAKGKGNIKVCGFVKR